LGPNNVLNSFKGCVFNPLTTVRGSVSVARFAGFRLFVNNSPSAEALGYFHFARFANDKAASDALLEELTRRIWWPPASSRFPQPP
jgi:hypothetical protein